MTSKHIIPEKKDVNKKKVRWGILAILFSLVGLGFMHLAYVSHLRLMIEHGGLTLAEQIVFSLEILIGGLSLVFGLAFTSLWVFSRLATQTPEERALRQERELMIWQRVHKNSIIGLVIVLAIYFVFGGTLSNIGWPIGFCVVVDIFIASVFNIRLKSEQKETGGN